MPLTELRITTERMRWELTIGLCFFPHLRWQNICIHGIATQRIRLNKGKPSPSAFLIQERIRGFGTFGTREGLLRFIADSISKAPFLISERT